MNDHFDKCFPEDQIWAYSIHLVEFLKCYKHKLGDGVLLCLFSLALFNGKEDCPDGWIGLLKQVPGCLFLFMEF